MTGIENKYYVTVTDIKRLLHCSHSKARSIFDTAREKEVDSGLILAHESKVALKTVIKLTGFDLNLYLKLKS